MTTSAPAPPGRAPLPGPLGTPEPQTNPEGRHGSAGASPNAGGLRGGPTGVYRTANRIRGAPRLCRGVSERGGLGGPFEAPHLYCHPPI